MKLSKSIAELQREHVVLEPEQVSIKLLIPTRPRTAPT
jgi:hypothetical protein